MCEAYARGMYGDNYVWILPGYHNDRWWSERRQLQHRANSNCTIEQLEQALDGHFIMQFAHVRNDIDTITVSGVVR